MQAVDDIAELMRRSLPIIALGQHWAISLEGWIVHDGRALRRITEGTAAYAAFGPDSGHVLRPGAGSQAAEILVEHHVEDPVQTVLDMPMASHGVGEQFGVKRHGGQVVASFEAGAAVALDLGLDHGDGAQPGEPRLTREPPCGGEPIDLVADHVAADLDAAMVAVGGLEVAVVFGGGVVEDSV